MRQILPFAGCGLLLLSAVVFVKSGVSTAPERSHPQAVLKAAEEPRVEGVYSLGPPHSRPREGIGDPSSRSAPAPDPMERRLEAIALWGSLWDRNGEIRKTLLDHARGDPDLEIRSAAIVAFQEYLPRHPEAAPEVNAALIDLALDARLRSVSISSLYLLGSHGRTAEALFAFANDPSLEVRVAVYEKLGEASALAALEEAFARERDEAGLAEIVTATARAGGIELLRHMARQDGPVRELACSCLAVLEER